MIISHTINGDRMESLEKIDLLAKKSGKYNINIDANSKKKKFLIEVVSKSKNK